MVVLTGASEETLTTTLQRHAATRPDAPWLIHEDGEGHPIEVRWDATCRRACRMANVLREHGVGAGDHVHIQLGNRQEFFDLWFAAALLGAVMVPTAPEISDEDLRRVIEHAACRVSVTEVGLADAVRRVASRGAPLEHVLEAGDALADAAAAAGDDIGEPPCSPTSLAAVLYERQGDHGVRGVLVSHGAYVHAGDVVAQHLRLRPDDRLLVVLPLSGINVQCYAVMPALVTGASVAMAPRFSGGSWVEHAQRMGATVAGLSAAKIREGLAAEASAADRAHGVRVALYADDLSADDVDAFEARFGCPLSRLYGTTETVAPLTMTPMYGERRSASIGRPVLGSRLRVEEDGDLLVAGEAGRTLMTGYYKDPAATAAVMHDGWLRIPAKVRSDEDGFLWPAGDGARQALS
jgi:crotonobetaine/carnitine-CoA ligase